MGWTHAIATVDAWLKHAPAAITTNHEELVMNQNILTECGLFINNQIVLQERLFDYHQKAYLTLDKLFTSNLKGYSAPLLHLYIWETRDTMMRAKELNLSMLNSLQSIMKFVEAAKKSFNGDGTVH